MKQIKKIITLLCIIPFFVNCHDDGITYENEINVPEGVYITGKASQFSVEAVKGKMNVIKPDTLYYMNTWLKNTGDFKISFVREDGQPVYYGQGSPIENVDSDIQSYSMIESGSGFSVNEDGLYQIIVNPLLKEINIVPYSFKIVGDLQISENGNNIIPFLEVDYDDINHIITWKSNNAEQKILASDYRLLYTTNESFTINETNSSTYNVKSSFTGPAGNIRTNVLTSDYTELNNTSDIDLKLSKPGNYIITLQYHVLTNKFFAKIEGEEIIEPEPQGYPETLYMSGDDFGNWNWQSSDVIEMVPVGSRGNGAFWTIKYFTAGRAVKWSSERSSNGSFASLNNNINFLLNSTGNATVQTSGLYLVYVDLHRKLIAFETPAVYGIGSSFNENETRFDVVGDKLKKQTLSNGNLRMFATSNYNDRDWTSMEFNIYNDQIIYRETAETEQEIVPVASDIPIELDFNNEAGYIKVPLKKEDVPSTAPALYMIGDEFGNMNWGSPDVEVFQRSFSEAYRWFHINYFSAGTGVRFSTSKVFGDAGEFVSLDNNEGFTVENGKTVIPENGLYMIYIDLNTRSIFIQRVMIYGYGTAVGSNSDRAALFEESTDGKTVALTLLQDGRLRLNPYIPAFSTPMSPTFGSWKREVALDPETLNIFYRLPGSPEEPNRAHVWKEGQKITLNFRTKKGRIE